MAKQHKRLPPSRQSGLEQQVNRLLDEVQRGLPQAGPALERLGRQHPRNPTVQNALGCLALERGEGKLALQHFDRAGQLGLPTSGSQARNRLIAHAMLGDLDTFNALWPRFAQSSQETLISLLQSAIKGVRNQQQTEMISHCLKLWSEIKPLDPKMSLAQVGLLLHLGKKDAALDAMRQMPPIDKGDTEALLLAAAHSLKLKQRKAAINYFRSAHTCPPTALNQLKSLIALGGNLNQLQETLELMERLLEHHPDQAEVMLYQRLNYNQQANRWEEVERLVPQYLAAVQTGHAVPDGLWRHHSLPGIGDAEQLLLANAYLAKRERAKGVPPAPEFTPLPRQNRRLRIGILSADFRTHPVAQLSVEIFERIDRSRFELIGYDLAEEHKSLLRQRILAAMDEVVAARELSDAELAEKIRGDAIDILIDLQGDTSDTRVWLMRERLAPIQVGWLGFAGTMGKGINDYILADQHVLPPKSFDHVAEQPVWLPHTYFPNDPARQPLPAPPRITQDLPEDALVFCCFNGQYKITREIFLAWCEILRRSPGSVLWLRKEDEQVMAHFRKVAEEHGLDPGRLIFAPRTATQIEHLTRLQCADIALDTRPYNAHTTNIDALWAGVATITLPGDSMTSRAGASVLHTIGLTEWIASSVEDYIAKAVQLANDPAQLQVLKARLSELRTSSVLYDAQTFTRGLEAALDAMYARFEQGLPPAPITHLPAKFSGQQVNLATDEEQRARELLLEQGMSLLAVEKVREAQACFAKVLAQQPDNPLACHGMGLAHALCGQYEEGLSWLDKALAQEPDNETWLKNRAIMEKKSAENYAAQLVEKMELAQQAHQQGDLATACVLYDEILRSSPEHPAALHYKGLAQVQQGQAEGLKTMLRALKNQPHNRDFLENYKRAEALLQRRL